MLRAVGAKAGPEGEGRGQSVRVSIKQTQSSTEKIGISQLANKEIDEENTYLKGPCIVGMPPLAS